MLLILCVTQSFAAKLPKLSTKQKISNIRYISRDNKFTYYQSQSGHLYLATNFSANVVLKRNENSQFFMHGNKESKKIIIEVHDNFFSNNSMLYNSEFGIVDYGDYKYKKLAEGVNPQLHLNGKWYSYYSPNQKMIFFQSLEKTNLKFRIELKNPIAPFFKPQVVMLNSREILFTDLNNRGEMGILYFDRGQNAIKPVFKTSLSGSKIELCKLKNDVFVGEFSRLSSFKKSLLYNTNWGPNTLMEKRKLVYNSEQNDIGKIICHERSNSIYLIKNLSDSQSNILERSELIQIEKEKTGFKIVSDLKNVGHIVQMDSRILIPFRGNIYVAHGLSDALSDKLEKKR